MSLRVTSGNYEITSLIDGLRYSNTNPGGDESCSFTFNRSWFASNPEIDKGNLVRVMDGIDVLFQGRIEETVRGGDTNESIAVTAYGLGRRLKDGTMQEIYVDRDLDHWQGASVQRKINIAAGGFTDEDPSTTTDTSTGSPSLAQTMSNGIWAAGGTPTSDAWYDANNVSIGSIYYAWKKNANIDSADANWQWQVYVSSDDVLSINSGSGNLRAAGPGTGTVTAPAAGYPFAALAILYAAAGGSANKDYSLFWTCLAVYGRHGLTKQGSSGATQAQGFFVSQMVADAVSRTTGITARRVDATTFVLQQAAYMDPTVFEDVVTDLNKYEAHQRTWGTWGPDSPLDASTNGYFDYRSLDTSPSWIAYRADCDSLPDLSSEMGTLYDTVKVRYTDVAGASQVVTRTRTVADLNGIPRTATLDGGTLTLADAQTLGDTFLALTGGFAPARGSIQLSRPIRHTIRGALPPHYMRADGSAVRIPDILPSTSLFALDSTPDRRTTFPIKRVEVDASGAVPTATVEVDQTNDALSALQARLASGNVASDRGSTSSSPTVPDWGNG